MSISPDTSTTVRSPTSLLVTLTSIADLRSSGWGEVNHSPGTPPDTHGGFTRVDAARAARCGPAGHERVQLALAAASACWYSGVVPSGRTSCRTCERTPSLRSVTPSSATSPGDRTVGSTVVRTCTSTVSYTHLTLP